MNIRDAYRHGVDGKGVVKTLFFATTANETAGINVNDLVFLLADTVGTQVPLTIPTLNLNTTGSAGSLKVVARGTNANHYLTFVDSNNTTAAAEDFYTDGDLYYNPSSNILSAAKVTVRNAAGFNYSGIETATANAARPIWFAADGASGIPCVNTSFKYNPSTNVLTVGAISGACVWIGDTQLLLNSTGTTNKLTPDTSISNTSTHGTIPSSKAVYDAILAGIQSNDAMIFKGFLAGGDSAANTTYTPGADRGHTYKVSTAGYINGVYYQLNDTFICTEDGTVAATSSNVDTVKANWGVVEGNGDFLSIHGGTMYGTLSWDGTTALPTVTTASSILVVDDNITKQISLANLLTSLNLSPSISNGTAANTVKITVSGIDSSDYTVPYAIHSSILDYYTISDPNLAYDDLNVRWYRLNQNSGYAGANYGFPTSNNANGLLWLGMHHKENQGTGPYGGLLGFSSKGRIYYRYISNGAFATTANGGSWKTIAWTSDLVNTWRGIYTGGTSRVGTGTDTKAMNFTSSNLDITYLAAGTGTGKSGNDAYFTINLNAKNWTGATSDTAGTAGYMPGASVANKLKYLRGDGSWIALSLADHTHTLSIAASTDNSSISLAASTKYKLTAGGSTYVFTTPPNTWVVNAVDTAGYVAAPTATDNKHNVWMTNGSGEPAWRAVVIPESTPTIGTSDTTLATIGGIIVKAKIGSYASSSHTHYYLVTSGDHRSVVTAPNDYANKFTFVGLKNNTTLGISNAGIYSYLVGLRGWSDRSGGDSHELAFCAGGLLYRRVGSAETTWGSWIRMADSSNISNKNAIITTSLTTIATIAGIDIKAKIPNVTAQAIELASIEKTLAVSTWTDMGAVSGLDAGTYAIQISSGNVYASGVFTACGGTDSVIDEIPLHVADSGTNTWRPYARISAGQLLMTTNELTGTARTYTIKILKLI